MPVHHFILHAYGSWHPDHERGWHQHGEPWLRRPDRALGKFRRAIQRWDAVTFNPAVQKALLDLVREIYQRRTWRCHAAAVNETHVHILASWRTDVPGLDAHHLFKRLLGWRCATLHGTEGRRWFSDGGLPIRIYDPAHLTYLVHEYLAGQGGAYWREGL